MIQLKRPQRNVETPKTPPTIHTMEQLLREESSKSKRSPTFSSSSSPNSSSPSSPFFQRLRHHDSEEDNGQNQKKSVLTKVKEKAKKLRHSLSKRKHEEGSPTSPSSATGVEGDGVEEDAEYLGAPMYQSEKAPAGYEANARQHSSPRGNPVFPEKHVLSSSDKHVVELDHQGKTLSPSISKKTTTQPATTISSPNATTATTSNINTNTNALFGLNKTMTETVAKKPTPVHAEKPDPAHTTSNIQDRTLSKPTEHHDHTSSSSSSSSTTVKTTRNTSLSYAAPYTPPAKLPSVAASSTLGTTSASVTPAPSSAPAFSGKNTSPTAQIWDKGLSMKEYLLNKLEPGEDEKALSQVISEAMSPRRTPGDAGVMEKVREAVTSLLRTEEPAKYADMTTTATATSTTTPTRISCQSPVSTKASRVSSQMSASTSASRPSSEMSASTSVSRSSSQIPVSFNAQQDFAAAEEENHGRILQTN